MRLFRIFYLSAFLPLALSGQKVTDYVQFSGAGNGAFNSEEFICLRKFTRNNHTYYLTVSPLTLKTAIVRSDSINVQQTSTRMIRSLYSSTPYLLALTDAEKYSDTIQDAGFRKFRESQKGIDLTIDLCPSKYPLDRIVFSELIKEISDVEKPVPLAISITGRWINKHPGDLRWLDSLSKAGELSIVWINHSYNHYTGKDSDLKKDFMLAPGTDINAEVLNTEIDLLEHGILPSVFFRFPGLISDNEIYSRILKLGLIPVGSDAWLSKGQWPKNGSIVLIHANGNDPVGVKDFIKLLKNKRSDILSKKWELFDLRESVKSDEIR